MRQDVLQQARQMIEARTRIYICGALAILARQPALADAAHELTVELVYGFEGHGSLREWLLATYQTTLNPEQERLARLAWLDKLISEETT